MMVSQMNDLVSYNESTTKPMARGNRDGEGNNRSLNCGVEGPTNIPDVNDLRQRQMRNMFATLLFSQGIPMICGGDEVARTQQGNNNAYCQDNEISWTNWHLDKGRKGTARLRFQTHSSAFGSSGVAPPSLLHRP